MGSSKHIFWVFLAGSSLLGGCDEPPKEKATATATATAPAAQRAPEPPKGPPQLAVDDVSPKVGWDRFPLNKEKDIARLREGVAAQKEHYVGKDVTLEVARKANLKWVVEMMDAIGAIGVEKLTLKTPTRTDYPAQLTFVPIAASSKAPGCSIVTTVLADRGTAVWRLQGGTALKRGKGLGGPDLSMTSETIEKVAKGCKESDWLFVQGNEVIEWGLVYDLAAVAHTLPKAGFQRVVLLREEPVAGRAVKLTP